MALFDRQKSSNEKFVSQSDIAGLIAALNNGDEAVQKKAASIICGSKHKSSEFLRYIKGESPAMQEKLINSLLKAGIIAVPLIVPVLVNIDPIARQSALIQIGRFGNPGFDAIAPLMEDGSDEIRMGAVFILGEMARRNPDALLALRHMLHDPSYGVCRAAAAALDDAGWKADEGEDKALFLLIREDWRQLVKYRKKAVPVLLEALQLEDRPNKKQIIRTLGSIHDMSAVPLLIRYCDDSDLEVRSAAIEALGETGGDAARSALLRALCDPYPQIRMEAAWALDRLGWHPEDDSEKVCYLIAKEQWLTLADMGRPAIEPLIRMLKEQHSGVRDGAIQALRRLGNPALTMLMQVGKRDDEYGAAALEAIRVIRQRNAEEQHSAPRKEDDRKFRQELEEGCEAQKIHEQGLIRKGRLPPSMIRKETPSPAPRPREREIPGDAEARAAMIAESQEKVLTGFAQLKSQRIEAPVNEADDDMPESPTKEDLDRMQQQVSDGLAASVEARVKAGNDDQTAGEPVDAVDETGLFSSQGPVVQPTARSADAAGIDEPIRDPVQELLRTLQHRDEEVRSAAVESLRLMGDAGLKVLIAALGDEDSGVRNAAAEALGDIGNQKAVGPLIQLLNDEYEYVRIAAAHSLGKLKNMLSITSLLKLFGDDYTGVRFAAADALASFGDIVLPHLHNALSDQDAAVRVTATRALSKCADVRSLPALLEHLGDEVPEVRRGVAQVLGMIGSAVIRPLIHVLEKGEKTEKLTALDALVNVYEDRATEAILIAMNDEDADIREKAAKAMRKREVLNVWREAWLKRLDEHEEGDQLIGAMHEEDEKAFDENGAREVENLIKALREKKATQQIAISMRLMMMGRPAVEGLIRALRDQDHDIRSSAAELLGEMREVAVEPLIEALSDDDAYVRTVSARSLGKIGSPRALDELIAGLKTEKNHHVRCVIAEALGYTGNRRAIDPLIAALRDRDEEVQMAAAHSLGYIGDQRAIEPLIQALNDIDYRVRHVALEALKDPAGVPQEHLVNTLKFGEMELRTGVAEALDQMGWKPENDTDLAYYLIGKGRWRELDRLDAAALEPLSNVIEDKPADIRLEAVKTVARIGGKGSVQLLIKGIQDENPVIRKISARALAGLGADARGDLVRLGEKRPDLSKTIQFVIDEIDRSQKEE